METLLGKTELPTQFEIDIDKLWRNFRKFFWNNFSEIKKKKLWRNFRNTLK